VLLETLDTEELRADGFFVIPQHSLRRAPESAENYRFQFDLSCPAQARGKAFVPRIAGDPEGFGGNASKR
jgi:hypothetical protein